MDNRILVFEMNMDGVFETDRMLRRLKNEFPDVANNIVTLLIHGEISPGSFRVFQSNGYTMACIFNRASILDIEDSYHPETIEAIESFTLDAIDELVNKLGNNKKYVSALILRDIKRFPTVKEFISSLKVDWEYWLD